MNLAEIIDRERKRAFGFTDDRRCLFTYGDFRRLLMEIEAAAKREKAEVEASALAAGGIVEASRHKQGNAAAMRNALSTAITLLKVCEWPDDAPMQSIAEVIDEIEKAFLAPPEDCDLAWTQKPYEQEVKEREESAAEGANV